MMEKRIRYYIHVPTGALRCEQVMYRHNREGKSKKGEYVYCCTARNYYEADAKRRGAKNPNTLYEYIGKNGHLYYATKDKLPVDCDYALFGVFDIAPGIYTLCQLIDLGLECFTDV